MKNDAVFNLLPEEELLAQLAKEKTSNQFPVIWFLPSVLTFVVMK